MQNNTVKKQSISISSTYFFQKIKNYFSPKFTDINGQKVIKKFPWLALFSWIFVPLAIILLIIAIKPDFQLSRYFWKSLSHFFDTKVNAHIGSAIRTPLDTFILSLQLLWKTIAFSILGTILGILISIPIALLSSKNFIKSPLIYGPFRAIMSIIRAIPPVVFAYIFFLLLSKELSATISIALFVSTLMTKWLYEDLDTYDVKSYYGVQAIGNGKFVAFKNSIFPYLTKRIFSYGFYSFEMVVRFAAILGIVGISTIGDLLQDYSDSQNTFSHMSIVIWVLIAFMIMLELINFLVRKYFLEKTPKHPKIDDKLPYNEQLKQLKKQKPKTYIWKISLAIVIIALIIAASFQVDWSLANSIKLSQFKIGIKNLFHPDWSIFNNSGTNPIILGFDALWLAIASSILGLGLALVIGLFASKNIMGIWTALPFKFIIIIFRAIPPFTFAALFLLLSKDSRIFAGTLALGFHSVGMLGKLINESIEKIPNKVFQSLDSLGCSWWQKIKLGVFKQIMPQALSNFLYRIEINFKTTVVLGVVGASDFGYQISIYSADFSNWNRLAPYLLFTIVILLIIEQISNLLRKKLMTGYWLSQDNWIKRQINKRRYIKALAISRVRKIPFVYERKWATYVICESSYYKLSVLRYFKENKDDNLSYYKYLMLKDETKQYNKNVGNEIKLISKDVKTIASQAYKETYKNSAQVINKAFFIQRMKIARRSMRKAVSKYFEGYATN